MHLWFDAEYVKAGVGEGASRPLPQAAQPTPACRSGTSSIW